MELSLAVRTKNISAFLRLPTFFVRNLGRVRFTTFCDFEYPKFLNSFLFHLKDRKNNTGKFTENVAKVIKFCFYIKPMLEFSVFKVFKYQNIRLKYSTNGGSFRRIRQIISWFPAVRSTDASADADVRSSPVLARNFHMSILLLPPIGQLCILKSIT